MFNSNVTLINLKVYIIIIKIIKMVINFTVVYVFVYFEGVLNVNYWLFCIYTF